MLLVIPTKSFTSLMLLRFDIYAGIDRAQSFRHHHECRPCYIRQVVQLLENLSIVDPTLNGQPFTPRCAAIHCEIPGAFKHIL
jgi:hypothetical protein